MRIIKTSIQLKKNAGRESQGACRQDELIGGSRKVILTQTLIRYIFGNQEAVAVDRRTKNHPIRKPLLLVTESQTIAICLPLSQCIVFGLDMTTRALKDIHFKFNYAVIMCVTLHTNRQVKNLQR
jgi:hypothetical protein